MLASHILRRLPWHTDWAVLFRLACIRALAAEASVRQMFGLPATVDLNAYSHAVLTSLGPWLAEANGNQLHHVYSGILSGLDMQADSLHARYRDRLAWVDVDGADCLGLGERPPDAPVVLHVRVGSRHARAVALFQGAPPTAGYELLKAVGVTYEGGTWVGPYYAAQFVNDLPTHVLAGELSEFSRTGHCNLFFLQHGRLDASLRGGLLEAASTRIGFGYSRTLSALVRMSASARDEGWTLTCQPPPPATAAPYGDLVPLGFVAHALRAASDLSPVIRDESMRLRSHLDGRAQQSLWSYHTNGLVTATDSALVLQGFGPDVERVNRLEMFADGTGAYYPQLWSAQTEPGRMTAEPGNYHWCQPDYPTTCLVRWLRRAAGLTSTTPLEYLGAQFNHRGGLFFANPYLVDWALALALAGDEDAQQLRNALAAEVLASRNADHSFGSFDIPMSSALAILTLVALAVGGDWLRPAQLRLLDWMGADGMFPAATPFYSTLSVGAAPAEVCKAAAEHGSPSGFIAANGAIHALTLYRDDVRLIATALGSLALAQTMPEMDNQADLCSTSDSDWHASARADSVHPRYRCRDPEEYAGRFALPAYLARVSVAELDGETEQPHILERSSV